MHVSIVFHPLHTLQTTEKMDFSVFFWVIYNEKDQFPLFSESLVIENWLRPHNYCKYRFNVGVSIHVYPSDVQNCPKMILFLFFRVIYQFSLLNHQGVEKSEYQSLKLGVLVCQ